MSHKFDSKPDTGVREDVSVLNHRRSDSLRVAFAVAVYALCSSTMLIVNKVVITSIPAPCSVLAAQLISSAALIKFMSLFGVIKLEPVDIQKATPYILVSAAFLGALYTNVKILQYANVETFLVFRASTPILISIMEFLFLGRTLPNLRSTVSLTFTLLGAVAYVLTDSNFQVRAYGWVLAWYVIFSFDQIYIKYVVDSVKLTVWARSFYANFFAVIPTVFLALLNREHQVFRVTELGSLFVLCVSCLMGTLMSYSAFLLRGLISATSFTLVGTLCKIGTVVVNCLMWDKHASFEGIIALLVCIFCGLGYQQAPLRNTTGGSS